MTDGATANAAYRDPGIGIEDRVADLLARMTLDEKVQQLVCLWPANIPSLTLPPLSEAAGSITHMLRAAGVSPREGAQMLNAHQRRFVEDTRLGIPALFSEEAVCGLQIDGATIFPDAIGLGSTWDPELLAQVGVVVGRQLRAVGLRQVLGPLCDVAQDPRWGRIEETYGEDPYLTGSLASAYVRAIQGRDVTVTLKHFIGYGASEGGRNLENAQMGPRQLREVHGLPFEMCIRDGGAHAVMASYNQIDGVPVQSSRQLLTEMLRTEYGFDGIVVSDLGGVEHLHGRHRVSAGPAESATLALRAGLDQDLPGQTFATGLYEAVDSGAAAVTEIDHAVARVLRLKFRLGLFENPYAAPNVLEQILDTAEDRLLARRAAIRSIVLLQNRPDTSGRPLLPLRADLKEIAVIGPNSDRRGALMGNYAYPVIASAVRMMETAMDPGAEVPADGASDLQRVSADHAPQVEGLVTLISVLQGIRSHAPAQTRVTWSRGCPIQDPDTSQIEEAAALARAADVAIVVVGDQSGIYNGATVGEGVDSASCELPGVQRQLVEAVASTGTPVILIMLNGRPFVLDWMVSAIPAIVEAWFPGEEGGNAVADVLFGIEDAAGRSCVGFPRAVGVAPAPYHLTASPGSYYDTTLEPIFPFGHGLSYTSFGYSDLVIDPPEGDTSGSFNVGCTVRNTGARPGEEVVQLYIHDIVARTSRSMELKGFQRLTLAPGEARRVTFQLAADRMALYDPTEGWVVEPGTILVMLASSAANIRLRGRFELSGATRRIPAGRVLVTPVSVGDWKDHDHLGIREGKAPDC
ncbi:MAG: glycoside hydrolase family 3 N-terminal domain-containing protein [Candidatus Dormibacteria bacterium]